MPPKDPDQELVRQATARQAAGESLTREQRAALRRRDKRREEELREAAYSACPKSAYQRLSGRQTKILHDQADRYGLPLRGATIDLGAVLRRFHDLLAEHGGKITTEAAAADSPALERKREAEADLKELDLAERRRDLVHRDLLRQQLAAVASLLRRAGEQLERKHGPAAKQLLVQTLDDAERRIGSITAAYDEVPVQ